MEKSIDVSMSQEKNLRPSKNVYKVVGHTKIMEKFLEYETAKELPESVRTWKNFRPQ